MRHDEVVIAVVPLFNPSNRLPEVVARLVGQCSRVVLVDDGSDERSWAISSALASERVSVLRRDHNAGIAAALNHGITHALKEWDPDFVLTCDQDSFVSGIYVTAALRRLRSVECAQDYALVTASAFNNRRVKNRIGRRLAPLEPMQSGMLIRASTFEQIGHFREDLFIDCVDTEFYLRCQTAGMKTLSAPPCPFEHHLGGSRWRSAFANRYSRHPPWRTYYLVRNRLETLRLYGATDIEWAVRIAAIQVPGLLATLVSSPDRLIQWSAMRMGYRDFRKGVSGPMSASIKEVLSRACDTRELPTRRNEDS